MIAIAVLIVRMLRDCFKSRRRLEAEILVLRHQLNVLQQRTRRLLHLRWADRAVFIWLYRRCPRILDAIWKHCRAPDPWRATPSIRADLVFGSDRDGGWTCGGLRRLAPTRTLTGDPLDCHAAIKMFDGGAPWAIPSCWWWAGR